MNIEIALTLCLFFILIYSKPNNSNVINKLSIRDVNLIYLFFIQRNYELSLDRIFCTFNDDYVFMNSSCIRKAVNRTSQLVFVDVYTKSGFSNVKVRFKFYKYI